MTGLGVSVDGVRVRPGRVIAGKEEFLARLRLLDAARAGNATAIQELDRRYHVRIVAVPPRVTQGASTRVTAIQEGDHMPDTTQMIRCDVCGVEVKRRGLGVHKARAHGVRRGQTTEIVPAARPALPAVPAVPAVPPDGSVVILVDRIQAWIQECQSALRVIAEISERPQRR